MSGHRVRLTGAVVLAAFTLLLQACTESSEPDVAVSDAPSLDASAARGARAQLLSSQDLPRLSGRAATITADDLADEASSASIATELEDAGYQGGFVRDLRGRSRDITGADSRVLVFSTPQGSQSFMASVAAAPDPFFGGPSVVRTMKIGTSNGYLIEPPLCDCPGAYPVYVGLVADGQQLLWLQLTGPRASPNKLRELLAGVAG